MFENSILDELTYDLGSGALRYKDVRYMLVRPETVIGFQKTIEEGNSELAQDAFFQSGFRGGYLSAENYKALHFFDDIQIIDFMMKMGTEKGTSGDRRYRRGRDTGRNLGRSRACICHTKTGFEPWC